MAFGYLKGNIIYPPVLFARLRPSLPLVIRMASRRITVLETEVHGTSAELTVKCWNLYLHVDSLSESKLPSEDFEQTDGHRAMYVNWNEAMKF